MAKDELISEMEVSEDRIEAAQAKVDAKVETKEEKRARVFARMRRESTGKKLNKKLSHADVRKINAFYGKCVDEYYDKYDNTDEMKEVNLDDLKGTRKSAFIDVMVQKMGEEHQAQIL